MLKVISRVLPLLMASTAFAQAKVAEAPVEKANLLTVVAFLVVFFGSCVGYFVYVWWNHRKGEAAAKE